MKKKALLFFVGLFTLAILIGIQMFWRGENKTGNELEEYTGQELHITRGEIARMISLLNYSREELESMERVITYSDTNPSKWYDKFVNGYCTMGLTEDEGGSENTFRPMAYFTYEECEDLLERLDTRDALILLEQFREHKRENDTILPKEWMELYQSIWMEKQKTALTETSLYIIESWENTDQLGKWQTVTNRGIFYGDGLNLKQYVDTSRKVFIKEKEILYIGDVTEEQTQISNVWIVEKQERILKVFVEGCTKEFAMDGDMEEELKNQIGDLFLENGKIIKVSIKPDRIKGRVLVTNDDFIEIENYGKKPLSKDFCIYRTYGEMSMDKNNSIVVGYENAEFVIVGNEICAAIITKPVIAETIRILIKTTGFQDYFHKQVTLTSNQRFKIKYGDTVKKYKANKIVKISPKSQCFKEGRLLIKTDKADGKITLSSINRNGIAPSYQGNIEIAKEEEGLLVVNELSIEQYLYGVVPSEMPSSYGVEALKVQSVCARSYAYKQLLANSLRKYGAHVDDSAAYQVYNNIPGNKTTEKAVNATCGETLEHEGEMITAYYFSTSSGYTANANQVWNSTEELPYLTGSLQLKKKSSKAEKKYKDLSKETTFKNFMEQDKYKTYDTSSAWYRWKVTIPKSKLKKSIDQALATRYEANPQLIQTLMENKEYKSIPIQTIGKVLKVEVTKRQTCGMATEIVITGSENTIKVGSEFNIRILLAPLYSEIIRQDGSKVESLGMLPSGFFYVEEVGEENTSCRFVGGGYGHGVGMSQNGTKAMTDSGFSYKEVLEHYYKDSKLVKY
ncbi:MAG: SpoIID/LytB domain-containing protein [Acetivibrio sp.]